MTLTDIEYQLLLDLYNKSSRIFYSLPLEITAAFFKRLYQL